MPKENHQQLSEADDNGEAFANGVYRTDDDAFTDSDDVASVRKYYEARHSHDQAMIKKLLEENARLKEGSQSQEEVSETRVDAVDVAVKSTAVPSPKSAAGIRLRRKVAAARRQESRDQEKMVREQQLKLQPMVHAVKKVVVRMEETAFEHPLATGLPKSGEVRALALFFHEKLGVSKAETALLLGVSDETIWRWAQSREEGTGL